MKIETQLKIASYFKSILFFMWVYTLLSKLFDWNKWNSEIKNQVFNEPVADILLYALPITYSLIAFSFIYQPLKKFWMYSSITLLSLFTLYIFLVLIHFFDRTPCSCAAIFKGMSWQQQFLFNIIFLTMAIVNAVIYRNERRLARH